MWEKERAFSFQRFFFFRCWAVREGMGLEYFGEEFNPRFPCSCGCDMATGWFHWPWHKARPWGQHAPLECCSTWPVPLQVCQAFLAALENSPKPVCLLNSPCISHILESQSRPNMPLLQYPFSRIFYREGNSEFPCQKGLVCWAKGFQCVFSPTNCNLLCCHSLSSFRYFWRLSEN